MKDTTMKKTLIAKTKILCTDVPTHTRHEVRLFDDGSTDCDCNGVDSSRLATMVMLGSVNLLKRSCASLVAFLNVGLPSVVSARVDATGQWGGWKDAWTNYCENQVVKERYRMLIYERDKEHAETFKCAHRAIASCSRYRNGMGRKDFSESIAFLPGADVTPGISVALYSSDEWKVPLQKGWMESIGKAKPVIDGRFIVGMNQENAGFVYAIDGTDEDGFEIREFAVVNGKLGKLAVAR